MRAPLAIGTAALLSATWASGDALAARPHMEGLGPEARAAEGPPYDGRFNFVRIRWGNDRGDPCVGRREPPWAHDMCRLGRGAEHFFAIILKETTALDPHLDGKVITLDDPELFRYPIAYIVEVGDWRPSDGEVRGLRDFLLKGGFLIVDDFRSAGELRSFQSQLRRAIPGVELMPVEAGHRIWDTFFHIPDPRDLAPSTYPQHVPTYLGIYEDNDPEGRLMAIVNFNQDLGEYWEWSPDGFLPIPLTNEAYKFGVNYIMYAMTH